MSVFVVLTQAANHMPAAIRLGCRVAKRLEKPVIGLTVMPDPAGALLMTGAGTGLYMAAGTAVIKKVEEAQAEVRAALEADFREICAQEGLTGDAVQARHVEGAPDQDIGRTTLLADAVIFPHDSGRSTGPHGEAFEATLMGRRQPVVIAGAGEDPNVGKVMIAWDGSPEAARALFANEAIIKAADEVILAQNTDKVDPQDEDGPENLDLVRAWLQDRGVTCEMRKFSGDVADGLLRLSIEEKIGLMIAGAYGHSRVEEFIFGGVSRTLLRSDDGPALALAH